VSFAESEKVMSIVAILNNVKLNDTVRVDTEKADSDKCSNLPIANKKYLITVDDIEERVTNALSKMTDEEKLEACTKHVYIRTQDAIRLAHEKAKFSNRRLSTIVEKVLLKAGYNAQEIALMSEDEVENAIVNL